MAAYSTATDPVASRISTSYRKIVPIAPADNTLIGPFPALLVGVAGTVNLVPLGQNTAVALTLSAGIWTIAFQGINTGGTATGLAGLG